jgi:hypothetical protein
LTLPLEWRRAWVAYTEAGVVVICKLRRGFFDCYLDGELVASAMSIEEAKDRISGKLSGV